MPTGIYNRTKPVWNKGISGYKTRLLRDETKRKISLALKNNKNHLGYKQKEETKRKIGLANSISLKGKHLSEETKRKMSENYKGAKRYNWKGGKNRFPKCIDCGVITSSMHTKRCNKCANKNKNGKNCNWWKGGISFAPYTLDWTNSLRISIRERDHYTCQICGEKQGDRAFDVHHIDYNKLNCNPDNLITLCRNCHLKTNHNREYWKKYFNNL